MIFVKKFDIDKSSNASEIQQFLDRNVITSRKIIDITTIPRNDDSLSVLIFWTDEEVTPTIDVAFEETESVASRPIIDARIGTDEDGVNNGKLIFKTGIIVQ